MGTGPPSRIAVTVKGDSMCDGSWWWAGPANVSCVHERDTQSTTWTLFWAALFIPCPPFSCLWRPSTSPYETHEFPCLQRDSQGPAPRHCFKQLLPVQILAFLHQVPVTSPEALLDWPPTPSRAHFLGTFWITQFIKSVHEFFTLLNMYIYFMHECVCFISLIN